MLKKLCSSVLLTWLFLTLPTLAHAKESISWLYFNFPPLYTSSPSGPGGFGVEIIREFHKGLPQYEHRLLLATPSRMKEELAAGKHVIVLGMLKTPARANVMHYSTLPCRLTSPNMVAVRTEDTRQLTQGGTISVETLFQTKDLVFGDIAHINYGKLQPLVDRYRDKTRSVITADGVQHVIKMIVNKRVDWTIVDPMVAAYYLKQDTTSDQISLVQSAEQKLEFLPGYIVAPKNQWGQEVLAEIDLILHKLIINGELAAIMEPYIPKEVRADFEKAFDEQIVKSVSEMNQ